MIKANDYRVGVLYAWTVAVVIAGTMDPANDRGYAWMSKMVERNGKAINDYLPRAAVDKKDHQLNFTYPPASMVTLAPNLMLKSSRNPPK
ncbi:MAG: hypothetical protein ACNYPE_02220 [Candidatus Azotimanducaceae bacterium WSBS_2022_MAG_OTU7]